MYINPIKVCDVVYISYNEEQQQVYWDRVKSMVPKAIHINGIHGINSAYVAAGKASSEDHVIIIKGDNWLIDTFMYDFVIDQSRLNADNVLSFDSIDVSTNLKVRGIEIWPREKLIKHKSHETATFSNHYLEHTNYIHNEVFLTITDNTASPVQSFIKGFRQAVKMCVSASGIAQSIDDFLTNMSNINSVKLFALLNVGSDVANGQFKNYGAKLALIHLFFDPDFNIMAINDESKLQAIFNLFGTEDELKRHIAYVDEQYNVSELLNVFFLTLDSEQSIFFKSYIAKSLKTTG